jgi:ribosomal protein S18 acetylase RimI-like enzyme
MLAVDARFGSRGVGRALVAAGEAAAAERYGAAAVVLYVLAVRTDILEWYGRRGYAHTGLRAEARVLIEGIHAEAKLLADSDFVILRRRL